MRFIGFPSLVRFAPAARTASFSHQRVPPLLSPLVPFYIRHPILTGYRPRFSSALLKFRGNPAKKKTVLPPKAKPSSPARSAPKQRKKDLRPNTLRGSLVALHSPISCFTCAPPSPSVSSLLSTSQKQVDNLIQRQLESHTGRFHPRDLFGR